MTRQEIVDSARSYVGVDYMLHGRSPIFGLDCWGFFSRVCHDVNVGAPNIPKKRYEHLLRSVILSMRAMQFLQISIPQIGDALIRVQHKLLAGHSGIMSEENKMIHATDTGIQETDIVGAWIGFEFPGVI